MKQLRKDITLIIDGVHIPFSTFAGSLEDTGKDTGTRDKKYPRGASTFVTGLNVSGELIVKLKSEERELIGQLQNIPAGGTATYLNPAAAMYNYTDVALVGFEDKTDIYGEDDKIESLTILTFTYGNRTNV